MTPIQALAAVALSLVLYAIVAAVFVAGGWYIFRRFGVRGLVLWWLLFSTGLTVAGTWLTNADAFLRIAFAAIATVGFGLASLSLRKRLLASSAGVLTGRIILVGVGAFFAGAGLCLIPVLISDLFQVMRH